MKAFLSRLRGPGLILAILGGPLLTADIQAHPTSFQGATSIELMNRPKSNLFTAHYSFSPRFSLGAESLRWVKSNDESLYAGLLRAGVLLHRINHAQFQANAYLEGGAGVARIDKDQHLTYRVRAQMDIEDRRYYFLTSLERQYVQDQLANWIPKARVGIAPYLAEFDELNSWLMLQYEYHSTEKKHDITPFLRFFYRNVLIEAGSSLRGQWMLNAMVHF
jgi:hypothetical protein